MKKRILSIVLVLCMVLSFVPITVFAAEGITPTTPQKDTEGVYQIGTAEELYGFAELVNSGNTDKNTKAVLTADITVNKDVLKADGTLADDTSGFTSWTPIGNSSNKYTGKFDGQGHTISGLYFNDTNVNYVGLFGFLGTDGEIKNVGVIDSYFRGRECVGGVCGRNERGAITGCYNTGTVSGIAEVGGVSGNNNQHGTITGCYNTGTVRGTGNVGGVCGASSGTITYCYNTGTVIGSVEVGGVCGHNEGTITGCYNTGTVSGSAQVGGVCGRNERGAITGCYTNNGGVCGADIGNTATDCEEYTGDEFKNGNVCGLLNTALKNYGSDVRFYQGVKSPEFIHAPQLVDGVYQIGTAEELYGFAQLVNNGNTSASAVLTADITVNSNLLNSLNEDGTVKDGATVTSWTPIGNTSNPYTGSFDGQGHTVSGLYFNDSNTSFVGLFGYLRLGGEIKNVGVIDSYFRGKSSVGGVCGRNERGAITGCYNTGAVSGDFNVGGVCGENDDTITGCYNTGTVSGSAEVGGVCGENWNIITGCYNIGTVSGKNYVGGVCGDSYSPITGCYNTGTVSGSKYVGGVCGWIYNGTITGCYNTGTVSGTVSSSLFIGGVCGRNYNSTITGCYNTGTVSGKEIVGGVCGRNYNSTIT